MNGYYKSYKNAQEKEKDRFESRLLNYHATDTSLVVSLGEGSGWRVQWTCVVTITAASCVVVQSSPTVHSVLTSY